MAARARPCAVRTRLSGLKNTPKGALRAPRPSQLPCSPKNKNKTISRNKMSSFRPKLGPPGAYIFPLHGLSCALLSYAVPSWATLPPCCEPCCTLLSYAAFKWAMLHSNELCCTLRCTLWAKQQPSELRWTLLSYGDPTELCLTLNELCLKLNELRGTLKV